MKNKIVKIPEEIDSSAQNLIKTEGIVIPKSAIEKHSSVFIKKYSINPITIDDNSLIKINEDFQFIFNSLSAKRAKKLDLKKYKIFINSISIEKQYSSILNNLHLLEIDHDFELKIQTLIRSVENENIDFEKFFYSFVNFSSKLREIASVNCRMVLFFNPSTNLIQAEMTRETTSGFFVNLSLQFSDGGNINYFVRDNDDENDSYISGTVTKYKKYSSSYRFNSIINLIFTGE